MPFSALCKSSLDKIPQLPAQNKIAQKCRFQTFPGNFIGAFRPFLRLVGLEPTRYHYRQILSLVRLPVPPQPQIKLLAYLIIKYFQLQAVFLIIYKFLLFYGAGAQAH